MYRYIDQVLCQTGGHESLLIIDSVIDNLNSSMTWCCFSHPCMIHEHACIGILISSVIILFSSSDEYSFNLRGDFFVFLEYTTSMCKAKLVNCCPDYEKKNF